MYYDIQKENNLGTSFTSLPPYLRGKVPATYWASGPGRTFWKKETLLANPIPRLSLSTILSQLVSTFPNLFESSYCL